MSDKPKKTPPRLCEVKQTVRLTPNMQRVTFSGDALVGFPEGRSGANIKLLLPEPDWDRAQLEAAIGSSTRPTTRTYTVRDYRTAENELDIDFVVHAGEGPAGSFAKHCRAGDFLAIAGPGPVKLSAIEADWFLFCADMSGLPATAAAIEALPADATGYAFFEITEASDEYPLAPPPGVKIQWFIHASPHQVSLQQVEAIKALSWPNDNVSLFAAGEQSAIKAIRDYVWKERGIPRANTYISGYWKIGLIEDQHQIEKRKDT